MVLPQYAACTPLPGSDSLCQIHPYGTCPGWGRVTDVPERVDDQEPGPVVIPPPARSPEVAPSPNGQRRYQLVKGSQVVQEAQSWLWRDQHGGLLPLGAMSLLVGKRGIGKSLLWVWLTARITTGTLPGCRNGKPGTVLVALPEDSKSEVVNRLVAAGADLDRMAFLEMLDGGQVSTTDLRSAVERERPTLAVVDATNALMMGRDSHKEAEVRSVLQPLLDVATSTGTAVQCVCHFRKGHTGDLLDAVNGSGAFGNVPRAVLGLARREDGALVLALLKASSGNTGRPGVVLAVATVEARDSRGELLREEDGAPGTVGRISLTGHTDGPGMDACRDALEDSTNGDVSMKSEAVDWLREYLEEEGRALATDVRKSYLAGVGTSVATLDKAKQQLGVRSERVGFGAGSRVYWRLP